MAKKKAKASTPPEEQYILDARAEGRCRTEDHFSLKALADQDHEKLQARVNHLDIENCKRLDEILQRQTELAPIIILQGKTFGHLRLVNGWHRRDVYERAGRNAIPAWVITVDDEDLDHQATLYATMCNQVFSLERTSEDIKKAAWILFSDPECFTWTDTAVGNHIGKGKGTINNWRSAYALEKGVSIPEFAIKSDGTKTRLRRPPGRPKVRQDSNGNMVASIDGKEMYLGRTESGAQERIAAIEKSKEIKRGLVSRTSGVLDFLCREQVPCRRAGSTEDAGKLKGLSAIVTSDAIIVASTLDFPGSVPQAVGSLFMNRVRVDSGSPRSVVICYREYGCRELISLAEQLGIEFLSPEEYVASVRRAEGEHAAPSEESREEGSDVV